MKKIICFILLTTFIANAQDVKFGKVSKEELEERFYDKDSTADAVYLLKKRLTHYEFDTTVNQFIVVTDVHERIKIYSKEGYEFANKSIKFYNPEIGNEEEVTGIKGYTYNYENGIVTKEKLTKKHVFEEKKSKYWSLKKIALPVVKKGSVIELKYQIRSPYNLKIDDVNFQYGIPVKKLSTKIKIPEYYVFKTNTKGYYFISPEKKSSSSRVTFLDSNRGGNLPNLSTSEWNYKVNEFYYEGNSIPALSDKEPYAGSVNNYRGGVSFELSSIDFPNSPIKYYSTTWEDVSKKIHDFSSFGLELDKKSFFKSDLEKVIADATNDVEKMHAVFNYVKSKVKWNGYTGKYTDNGVRKAYKEGAGNVADINLLLTSMLREAGLKSDPVLVSTKENGIPLFPTMDGFNYVISSVEFSGGTSVLLDATEIYSIPGILPSRVMNWKGRKVNENGISSWVNLESKLLSVTDYKVYAKITSDFAVEGLVRTTYKNHNAFNYRKKNNELNDDELISKLEESYEFEASEIKVLNKENFSKPISQSVKFIKDDCVEEIGDKIYLNPLILLGYLENPFKSNERNFPIDFVTPWQDKFYIDFTIPEGYKVDFLPEAQGIGLVDNIGVFKFQATSDESKIKISCILQFNKSIISPQYYEDIKGFFSKVVKKQTEKIVLIKS